MHVQVARVAQRPLTCACALWVLYLREWGVGGRRRRGSALLIVTATLPPYTVRVRAVRPFLLVALPAQEGVMSSSAGPIALTLMSALTLSLL